jgi:hypothetical protein
MHRGAPATLPRDTEGATLSSLTSSGTTLPSHLTFRTPPSDHVPVIDKLLFEVSFERLHTLVR